LTVTFTDASSGSPTSWSWNFGDGGTSTAQNPSHQYTSAGIFDVTLTATNAGGNDVETKTGYITVTAPPPPTANFTGTPTSGLAPLTVAFTDSSTGNPTSWSWNFGDNGTSTQQSPSHTYQSAGTYTVTLTATNAGGSDTLTRTDYISVTAPPDFAVSATPAKQVVVRGGTTSYTVTVTPLNGFLGTVDLAVSGLPSGTTGSFSPTSITVPPTGASALAVTTSSTMKAGSYTLTITGTSGGLSHSTTVVLQVKRK
jgi:PKD repeat protein